MELGKRKGRAGFSEKFLKHSNGGKISGPAATIYSVNPVPENGIVEVPPIDPRLVKSTVEKKDGKTVIKLECL